MFSFETIVDDLWKGLRDRHGRTVGRSRTLKYAPAQITRPEFREWLRAKSVDAKGVLWRCEETGNILSHKNPEAKFRLTIDHREPLDQGGLTVVSNLAIVSKAINEEKKSLSLRGWAAYKAFKAGLSISDRRCVERQMRAAPSVAKFASKKAAAAAGEKW